MQSISDFLQKNRSKRPKVLVVGDCMLDEYYNVKVTRISPESPNVAVMLSDTDEPVAVRPGGAANVCYQLKHFNCHCDLLGFADNKALASFSEAGLNASMCVTLPSSRIPRKRRFFDGDSQVSDRWDIERPNYGLHPDILEHKRRELQRTLIEATSDGCDYDAIVLSDYAKGVFGSEGFVHGLSGVPIIVDPKKGPLEKWRGCTVLKPNYEEACHLTGKTDPEEQAAHIKSIVGCNSVVITHNGKGVYILDGGEFNHYAPITKRNANSVIGAGDAFGAVLALCLAHKLSVREAAEVAFEAGAIYVQQKHNQPVTPWELQKQSKFVTAQELRLRDRSTKLVFTNGCFYIMHSGHLDTLKFARSNGDKLVVAVNSDESVSRLKGTNRPVMGLEERKRMLAALECVDFVVSFEEDTPLEIIQEIRPDVLVKGGDYKVDDVVGGEFVPKVVIAPFVEDHSTTTIIDKIKALT